MMDLLTRNTKMRRSGARTYNFGIPALKSQSGFKTCPNARACARGCYARQGFYTFRNAQRSYEWRLRMTQLRDFPEVMQIEIDSKRPERVRIHDSGDFYSREYLDKWIEVAARNTEVFFYCYTKMVSMLKTADLPPNFSAVFSYGGLEDCLINPDTDRHSMVFATADSLKASGYADASVDDSVAVGENRRIGLIYHGANSKNWGTTKGGLYA